MSPLYAQTTSIPLDIAIIGAGIAGLATAHCLANAGHRVTVYEGAKQMGEVGAGIHVSPNVTRLMSRWGLDDKLEETCVELQGMSFYRWESGEKLQTMPVGSLWKERYGFPYYAIHRADLHTILHDLAAPNMTLRLDSRVISVDPSTPTLTLHTGEVIKVDLIIGADGVKSIIRPVVVGHDSPPMATGDAAYRSTIPASEIRKHPELEELFACSETSIWMGPEKHVIGYPIRANEEYNILMLHPDNGSSESWTKESGKIEEMMSDFAGWEPRVQKLLGMITKMVNWKLIDIAPLDNWAHKDGKVVLVGDACHAMLPYRAQGAAMAMEDAAVLGNLFSRLTSQAQIKPLLEAYTKLRNERATKTQAESRASQTFVHMPDGPAQQERDGKMREMAKEAAKGGEVSMRAWGDADVQSKYDADAEVERWWKEGGEESLRVNV